MNSQPMPREVRTVFLSDLHLGTRACKAEFLLDFLRHVKAEQIYLVGDIVDGWALKRSWYWPQAHADVVQKLLKRARKGVRVVFVPGNHDECFREYVEHDFGSIEIVRETVHETADGKRLLVCHGDEYDVVCTRARWLALLGDWGYTAAVHVNGWFNKLRSLTGRPYWSLAGYLKRKVKSALTFIDDFENELVKVAAERGLDGVVCGHIHEAKVREIDGRLYCNDGDWVDSCTALVEHFDGRLELVDWIAESGRLVIEAENWDESWPEAAAAASSTVLARAATGTEAG